MKNTWLNLAKKESILLPRAQNLGEVDDLNYFINKLMNRLGFVKVLAGKNEYFVPARPKNWGKGVKKC